MSPSITQVKWSSIIVEGLGRFKDVKVWPGGAREWDWTETGTQHSPGIQPSDVQELVDRGAKTIVLSEGMQGRLKTCPETLDYLEENNVSVHRAQTEKAVELFNELAESESVGGLFHSTC